MKKVLFIATVVKTHIMTFHVPYMKWLSENGYEVHVVAKNDYSNKTELKIPFCQKYIDVPFMRSPFHWENYIAYRKVKKIIETGSYEFIHCHTPVGGVIGRLAARNMRKKGVKVLYTAHGFHFYSGAPIKNWILYYPIEKKLSKYTDYLITINKEDYYRSSRFNAESIKYVPGVGIDLDKFQPSKQVKINSLGNFDESKINILSVGELNKNKNHEIIIKAMSKINNKNIIYNICGDGELREYLEKMVEDYNLKNHVRFLGYRSDIKNIMEVSDIFVFPSKREGLSLSLMEAMASGLPVICSSIRGNSDLVKHNHGGYLINENSADAYLEAINVLASKPHLRREFGTYNKDIIKKYSIENVLPQVTDIYKHI